MSKIQLLLRYSLEGFLLYLVLVPFYIRLEQLPPLVPFLLVFYLPVLSLLLLMRKKENLSFGLLLSFVPVFAGLAWILGFPLFLAMVLVAACCWRMATLFLAFRDPFDDLSPFVVFFVSLGFALLLYTIFPSYVGQNAILIIMLSQFVFLLGMEVIRRLIDSEAGSRKERQIFLRWGSGTVGGLVVGAVLLLLLYPVVKWVFFKGFGLLAHGLGVVLGYPVFWLLSLLTGNGNKMPKEFLSRFKSSDKKIPDQQPPSIDDASLPLDWILFGLVAALFIVVFIYFYRKRIGIHRDSESQAALSETYSISEHSFRGRRRRGKPPKDEVRKRFYQLQRKLGARGVGRSSHESVGDWFNRLHLDPDEQAIIADDYRKVRYGNASLSAEEMDRYERAVRKLLDQAKKEKKKREKDE
ncbi:MAG TPA: DUF4129 domain-containing protein [Bacillales bacterium]|nr:DUF4129 domain-containing protein [Bacillales bacterium]